MRIDHGWSTPLASPVKGIIEVMDMTTGMDGNTVFMFMGIK
jgi:hypothetical protein